MGLSDNSKPIILWCSWCHRIFPIQATCTLNEKELTAAVSKLVLQFVNDGKNKLVRPVKVRDNFIKDACICVDD